AAALGCQHLPPWASTQVPPGSQTLQGVRASFQTANPNSRVGVVNAALPARHMVSVADLPLNEIQEGDVLSILNEQGRDLVEGEVIKKTDRWVQVRYLDLPPGSRDPRPGDLVAWVPGGPRVNPKETGTAINPAAPVPQDVSPQPPATEPSPAQPAEPPAANPNAPETMPAQPI